MKALCFQLLLQPFFLQPSPLHVFRHDPAVHDDLGADMLLRRRQAQVGRICRALAAVREDRELSVILKDGGLNVVEIKVGKSCSDNTREFVK